MDNTTLLTGVCNNITSWPAEHNVKPNIFNVRDLALKIIYIIIGTIGVLDNLFVIIVFVFFIKIADKVLYLWNWRTVRCFTNSSESAFCRHCVR